MFNNISELEQFIGRMIDKLDESRTDSFELEVGDVKIKLGKGSSCCSIPKAEMTPAQLPVRESIRSAEPEAVASEAPSPVLPTVNAPLLGVAYAAPSPDSPTFIKVGDKIKKGDIICIIEAMKVMNEIESDRDGEVAEILFENGKMVEFGQPLISVK